MFCVLFVSCGDDDCPTTPTPATDSGRSNLGNRRTQWNPMSLPRNDQSNTLLSYEDRYRHVEWYNPEERVRRSDLDPTLDETEGNQFITVLEIALKGGSFADTTGSSDAWGGIMRVLSKSGVDYSQRNFIEIWINGPEEGLLHIDLGTLSEDAMWQDGVAPNGRLDSEDRNQDGRLDNTGTDDPLTDEDTGLDGLFNGQETCVRIDSVNCDPADPSSDDWDYDDDQDYSRINRTEKNGRLDTEDLNTSGGLTLPDDEVYFHYTINLDPAIEQPAAVGATGTQWRFYRIALAVREENAYGIPQLSAIRMARLWFEGAGSGATGAVFQIASIEVTTDVDTASARR
jgi:cell surface protein SprA